LPVIFVCKDDGWAITTQSDGVTGGDLGERARAFGVPATEVDGRDVSAVLGTAEAALGRARSGGGPSFLHARCVHLEAHFLGFPLLQAARHPLREMPGMSTGLARGFLRPGGAALRERVAGVKAALGTVLATLRDPRREAANDPVQNARTVVHSDAARMHELEERVEEETRAVVEAALAGVGP
jgi:TPP-dependent pyruvate/acetoin dehydrogenase alpha subunit